MLLNQMLYYKQKFKFIKNYFGFYLGVILFSSILLFLSPEFMPVKSIYMTAIVVFMAVWWISEALPIPVTALLPVVLYPLFKIMRLTKKRPPGPTAPDDLKWVSGADYILSRARKIAIA